MNIIRKNIPNSITCINIACGVLAILTASHGSGPLWGLKAYEWSWLFIGFAAIADFFDGFAARLLKAYSDMGKELDSLCDLVSFGVAPAITMYYCLGETATPSWVRWLVVLIPVAGALRLAKFNIDTRQTVNFIGLPIPANAIFWIGYSALCYQGVGFLTEWWWFIPILLVECWLMISSVGFFSLKFKTWGWKGNALRWMLIITAPVLVLCLGVGGLLWTIVAYALYSIFDKKEGQ